MEQSSLLLTILITIQGLHLVVGVKPGEASNPSQRTCPPTPLLPLYFNRPQTVPALDEQSYRSGSQHVVVKRSLSADSISQLSNFSLAVGNIDMPIASAESSMHTALKLWSTIGTQLDGGESDADSGEIMDENPYASENLVQFRKNRLTVQGLKVSMLNIHLLPNSEPRFSIGIQIKNTSMTGQFSYKGPVHLSSHYRLSIDNIYLIASSNLTKDSDNNLKLRTSDLSMNITNVGYIAIEIVDANNKPTSNYLLRILQRVLQKSIKKTYLTFETHIKRVLEQEARRAVDCEVGSYRMYESDGPANSNDLARLIGREIKWSNLSTVVLPEFEHQNTILGTNATIQFYNGSLSGLENFRMDKETRIKLQDEHLLVNASCGWSELRPYYNWNLTLGGSKSTISKGFVSFHIKSINFDAVITKGISPQTRLVVEQLTIEHLENPKMDIGGLPGMNRITRGMVNFFMGRLKQRLTGSIQPILKQQLERTLNKMMTSPVPVDHPKAIISS